MLICTIAQMQDEIRSEIMENEQNRGLKECLQNGVECTVTEIECLCDPDTPEYNYYNIVFKGGLTVTGISGYHLSGIEEWKD